jgi:hypothetical protein
MPDNNLALYEAYAKKWGLHPDPQVQALLVRRHPYHFDRQGRPLSIWDRRHPARSWHDGEINEAAPAPEPVPAVAQGAPGHDRELTRRMDGLLAQVRLLTSRVNCLSDKARERQDESAF